MDLDSTEPLGHDANGAPVMLQDVWPTDEDIAEARKAITPSMFRDRYKDAMSEPRWDSIPSEPSLLYPWQEDSTYIRLPTLFQGLGPEAPPIAPIDGAACCSSR